MLYLTASQFLESRRPLLKAARQRVFHILSLEHRRVPNTDVVETFEQVSKALNMYGKR